MVYEERFYRKWMRVENLISFSVKYFETDLWIQASQDLTAPAQISVEKYYNDVAAYIKKTPGFLQALTPYPVANDAPNIVKEMAEATALMQVGPMAAVAGAMAQFVGRDLLAQAEEVIIENGGDIFLQCKGKKRFSIYTGKDSPFTNRIIFEVAVNNHPLGVCTSSGTVGHSLSFGKADAVVVIAESTLLADAAATALTNRIKTEKDIQVVLEEEKQKRRFEGIIIALKDKLGVWGNIKVVK